MSMKTKGYYQTMAAVVNSQHSDETKQELTGLLTKTLANKLWTAFEAGLESGELERVVEANPLGSAEDAYKAGVLSLAAWMMAELEDEDEDVEGEEEEDDMDEDEEENKNIRMHIRMGLN